MSDDELYLKATKEVDSPDRDPALWAKAMALTEGDEEKARYKYIKSRVDQLAKQEDKTSEMDEIQSNFSLSRAPIKTAKYFRWVGVIASVIVLIIFAFYSESFLGYHRDKVEVILYLIFVILPSFSTTFLICLKYFKQSFIISLWLVLMSFFATLNDDGSPKSMILMIAAVTICITSYFLNQIFGHKDVGQNNLTKE